MGTLTTRKVRVGGATRAATGAALIAFGFGGAATAQIRPPALPGAARDVSVTLSASARYDSNIAGGGGVVAATKNLRPDDILYAPSAKVDVVFPLRVLSVFLNGDAGYDFYQYNRVLQRARVNLVGGLSGGFGPCTGGVNGGYSVRQSDQADLPLQTTRNTQKVASYGAQASCSEGAHLGESLGVQRAEATNSAKTGVVNSTQTGVNGSLSWTSRLVGSIGLTGGYSKVEYGTPDSTTTPTPPGFHSINAGLNFSRPIGRRLNGSVGISYGKVHSEAGVSDYSTWSGHGTLQYKVTPRADVTLNYERDAVPTVQQGFSYAVLQKVSVDGHYNLSRRLSTSLGAYWSKRSYQAPTTVLPNEITRDDGNAVYGGVTFTLLHGASITLDVRHSTRNTNLTVFNYKDDRVGLTASKTF